MFSSIIRLGAIISGVAILSSCGGSSSSVAETQQSTPEGLFSGVNSLGQSVVVFVTSSGPYYAFYPQANNPAVLARASQGTFSFSGGIMVANDSEEITLPQPVATPPVVGAVFYPSFVGSYTTGQNIAGSFSYPVSGAAVSFNLNYNIGYQGVQNLTTLAGQYSGTVGTSVLSEAATFTFGTPSVLANSGNPLGAATVTGTGAGGCVYTGTVSPLFKGNGYNLSMTSGAPPCSLPNTQFSGLIYLNTATNILYSYAPDTARTDGLIFSGKKN